MTVQATREWAAALSAGDCEEIVHAGLREHDMKAVVYALRLLATKDPRRAQELLDTVRLGIALRTADSTGVVAELRAMADQIESTRCTGVTATWCPIHGDCRCADINGDPEQGRSLSDAGCPLHDAGSSHAEAAQTGVPR